MPSSLFELAPLFEMELPLQWFWAMPISPLLEACTQMIYKIAVCQELSCSALCECFEMM